MTKKILLDEMSKKIPRAEAERAIACFTDAIVSVASRGEKVILTGFGTFERQRRDGRTARNPRNGEPVEVAPRDVLKFSGRADVSDK